MISPVEILKNYWGFSSFREPQLKIINAVLEQKDVIALLPTGGGKSVCFQIPALAKEGVCLVISPLIALMKDQVENLQKLDIKATTIPSGTKQDDIITLFDNIKFGKIKFLYLSPERLQSVFIQQKLQELNINLVAIDEAHCISEWGHDFRPSYRTIKILRTLQPNAPFIAVTATANQRVLHDIAENLELKTPIIFRKSFSRENLAYQVFTVEDKLKRLLQIFTKTKTPAIVYVNSRKRTLEISNFLQANHFKSSYYHAGLSRLEKQTAFDNWMSEKTRIIVATNAFGMGIDKPNVGVVVHFNLPSSVENYVQETGRAGRNGKKSFAVLLQNENDILLFKEKAISEIPSILEIKEIHKKLYQYFNIANGEILEETFPFNNLDFCRKYNFSVRKTNTTLKILSNNGIIEISNNYNEKSTLQFITSSRIVLNYIEKNSSLKKFTNSILRNYGGLFEHEIKIDEFIIAKKAGITSAQVITYLKRLHKDELVLYNPVKSDTEIALLVPREDDKTINRCSKEIEKYIHQRRKKNADLIKFITNNTICRSEQVLNYFDESTQNKCGICDVCLQQKKKQKTITSADILQLLEENKSLSSQEISQLLETDEKEILLHLRFLLSSNKISINHQNKFKTNN
ncbi:RecQ family ATP-dependent DNA helicase [Polaribacter sp.]|uniref:RecQ family ATP-dependent DNA helicase n=1 Tax=Polaribacter sp. TaxID=1920175 RepID=UPI003EF2C4F2